MFAYFLSLRHRSASGVALAHLDQTLVSRAASAHLSVVLARAASEKTHHGR